MPIKIPEVKNLNANVGASSLRVSLGVAQQQANALGSLAAPIGATGDMLFNLSQKIQEADNVKNVSEAELSFDEQSAKYLQSLEGDFEENEWVPGATEMAKNMRKQFESRNLSPSAKRRLATKLDRKESSLLLRVGGMAAQQIAERANESTLLQLEMAAEAGDQFSYNEVVEERVAAGISSPEEGDRLKHEGTRKIRTSQIMGLANTNPKDAMQEIADGEWDDVPSATRDRAIYRAKIVDNEHQREFLGEISYARERGELPTVEQVESWVESGQMTKKDAVPFLRRIKSDAPRTFDAVGYQAISAEIGDYNPAHDDDARSMLTALNTKISLGGWNQSEHNSLISELKGAMMGGNQTTPGEVKKMARDRIDYYSRLGHYGLKWDDDGKVIPESEKTDADNKAPQLDAIDTFFREHPTATREEGLKAVDAIVSKTSERAGAAALASLPNVTQFNAMQREDSGSDNLPVLQHPPENTLLEGGNPLLIPTIDPETQPSS